MMIACSSKLDIPLHELVYRPQYPWVGVYMKRNLKALRYTRKRPLYADGRRSCMESNNLVQSRQYTTEAW
jgi:hypothetical protein